MNYQGVHVYGRPQLRTSVAMATHNGEAFLAAQLDSISAQTELPYELVVSDDASSDNTLSVLFEFARSAPFPVRILQNSDRLGYAKNFMRAASLCRGDLVAFCDQDDIWARQKLSLAVDCLREPGTSLCIHRVMVVDRRLRRIRGRPQTLTVRIGKRVLLASGLSMVVRKSVLETIESSELAFPPHMGHDWFVSLVAVLSGEVRVIAPALVLWRRHGGNYSTFAFTRALAGASAGEDDYSDIARRIDDWYTYVQGLEAAVGETGRVTEVLADLKRGSRSHWLRAQLFSPRPGLACRLRAFASIVREGYPLLWGSRGLLKNLVVTLFGASIWNSVTVSTVSFCRGWRE